MYIIGIDVGTTGTKAAVIDDKGRIISTGYQEYELKSTAGGCVTQNAGDWWDACVNAVKTAIEKLDASKITAIGLSTQGASMLAVDRDNEPLCDVMTWMDNRATDEVMLLDREVGGAAIYEKCGWQLTAAGDSAKILWLKNNMPDVFSSATCFPSTLEFINRRLVGEWIVDPTNAAIRQLYNIKTQDWDDDVLSVVGIERRRLPKISATGAYIGNLTPAAAMKLGLSTNVKIYNGSHDQYCAAIGCGAVNTGDMLLATGTTWVVLGVTDRLLYTKSHIAPGIHPVGGKFGAMASLISAGSALKWYRSVIDGGYQDMDNEAAGRTESAKDLFFAPYLLGAGFPHNKADAFGSIYGLSYRHDKYDIALALMEGVAFETKQVLKEFSSEGMPIKTLMMTGGAARSELWSSLVGYVTGCDIFRMKEPETCCVGAAMLAAVGIGAFDDYKSACRSMVRKEQLELSDQRLYQFYAQKEEAYRAMLDKVYNFNNV